MISFYIILVLILMSSFQAASSYYDDYFLPDSDNPSSQQTSRVNKQHPPEYEEELIGPNRPTGYICSLCIVVDEEFSEAYNLNDAVALKNSLQKFVDHANWVFRTVDWDRNGKSDNIGLRTYKILYGWKPYKMETKEHYETPKPALELLKIFARLNFTSCCLGVGFTNRPFKDGLDGISFAASDRLLGGICDHRNPHEDFMTNMNVALISGRGGNKSQLTSYQIAKAFIHELGHAFGVPAHDNDYQDPQCWGFSDGEQPESQSTVPHNGRYIMWNKSPQSKVRVPTLKKHTLRFSPCSKVAVSKIVNKRKNRQKCFELDFNPFCGNGIVEGMEMCDCGNEYDCSQQKCCGSRKSKNPCVADTKICGIAVVGQRTLDKYEGSSGRHYSRWWWWALFNFILVGLLVK